MQVKSDLTAAGSVMIGKKNASYKTKTFAAFKYAGPRDSNGLFHGGGYLTFTNGDEVMADFRHGVRDGDGVVISPRMEIARLCGTYVRGKLQGKGKLVSTHI
jgi:hypothetical protein